MFVDILFDIFVPILVTIITYTLTKTWWMPNEKFKELKAKTNYTLILYANVINNPIDCKDKMHEATAETRKLAAEWSTFRYYKHKFSLFIIKDDDIIKISSNFIGISNSIGTTRDTIEFTTEIKDILNLNSKPTKVE